MSPIQKKAVIGLVVAAVVTAGAFIPGVEPYVAYIIDFVSHIPGL